MVTNNKQQITLPFRGVLPFEYAHEPRSRRAGHRQQQTTNNKQQVTTNK